MSQAAEADERSMGLVRVCRASVRPAADWAEVRRRRAGG